EARVELPESVRRRLARRAGDVVVGVRPEDFVLSTNGAAIQAAVEITEALGPETLAHLRAQGLRIAHLGERAGKSEDEQSSELSDTVVVRFDSNTAIRTGEQIRLMVNGERVQLFDPASGDSLLAR
ncbi:MAG: TOBE domain-containing protein, partial [Acidobacteriota bacterium]|nr:TOBE domain-containing protein [Acidobacteriota bacterium]